MANEDKDLVSQVRIEGADKATADLNKVGDAGQKAFEKIADGATKASDKIAKESAQIQKNISDIGKSAPVMPMLGSVDRIAASWQRVRSGINQAGAATNVFRERVTRVAKVATASIGGFIAATALIAKTMDDAGKSTDDNTQAQIRALNNNNALAAAERGHAANLRTLNRDLASGKITYEQYASSVADTNFAFREQQREMAAAQAAERALAEDTKRLQVAQAKQDALNSLIDKFGGPLTSSLLRAGRASQTFLSDVQRTLGPPLASLVGKVTDLFEKNRTSIITFFDSMGAAIKRFADNGGVENTFNAIAQAVKGIGTFITKIVIPAFAALKPVLDGVATAINAVFGTELTGGAVAIIVVLGLFTKSFTILFGILQAGIGTVGLFVNVLARLPTVIALIPPLLQVLTLAVRVFIASLGPVGLALTAVTILIGVLYAKGYTLTGMFDAVKAAAIATVTAIRTGWNNLLTFFSELPGKIGEFFAAIWQNITDGFNAALAFLQSLPGQIGNIFLAVGDAIKQAFTDAIEFVVRKFNELLAAARRYIQPVIDMLNTVVGLIAGASGAATGGQVGTAAGFSGGGKVRGAGTGTSDSIFARLSNGEYVIKAASVLRYGKRFFDALNSGKFNLDNLKGFAMGGLVGAAPVLSFAGGGEVSTPAQRVLNLTIGQEEFKGLSVPDDVANRMVKYSVKKQGRAAGKRPTWVR